VSPGAAAEARKHEVFRRFLLDVEPAALPALRHLVECSFCREMARILLRSGEGAAGPGEGSE
jgi:hypothetical protein